MLHLKQEAARAGSKPSEEQARDVLAALASRRLLAVHQAAPIDEEPDDNPGELLDARDQARR